jgi:hypothetical protein
MGTLVPLFNQGAATLQGFQIQSQADMNTALTYLAAGGGITGTGYTRSVDLRQPGGTNTPLVCSLSIVDANGIQQLAFVNDWIILANNTVATVCKVANFAGLYHT